MLVAVGLSGLVPPAPMVVLLLALVVVMRMRLSGFVPSATTSSRLPLGMRFTLVFVDGATSVLVTLGGLIVVRMVLPGFVPPSSMVVLLLLVAVVVVRVGFSGLMASTAPTACVQCVVVVLSLGTLCLASFFRGVQTFPNRRVHLNPRRIYGIRREWFELKGREKRCE